MSDFISENNSYDSTENCSCCSQFLDSNEDNTIQNKIENLTIKDFENIFNSSENFVQKKNSYKNDLYFIQKKKSKQINFVVTENDSSQFIKKKRGRQINKKEEKNKIHDKYSSDNLQRKIQVHYITFIVSFLNEVLKALKIKQTFLKLNYNFKKNVAKDFVDSLKRKNLGEIISNEISDKYKKDKYYNKKIYEELKENEIMKKIFNINYITFFKKFYFKSEKVINLKIYGIKKDIVLSKESKMFKNLLDENMSSDNNDEEYIKNIKECVFKNFLPAKIFLMC